MNYNHKLYVKVILNVVVERKVLQQHRHPMKWIVIKE